MIPLPQSVYERNIFGTIEFPTLLADKECRVLSKISFVVDEKVFCRLWFVHVSEFHTEFAFLVVVEPDNVLHFSVYI